MGGLPRRATWLRQFLAEHAGAVTIQVDAGGLFNSRIREPENERIMWRATQEIGLDLLNLVPPDAAALLRMEGHNQALPSGNRPQLLSANVLGAGRQPVAPAYVVRRGADGARLIFIGLCEAHVAGNPGYFIDDPKEALARLLPTVNREGAVVIVLAYMPALKAVELSRAVKGVDIIISGHDDEFAIPAFQSPGTSTWMLQSQYEGRFVGYARLRLSAPGRLADFDQQAIITLDGSIADDPRIATLLNPRP